MISLLDCQWKTNVNPMYYGFRKDNEGDWHLVKSVWRWKGYDTLFCELIINQDGCIDIEVTTEFGNHYGAFYSKESIKEPIIIQINKQILKLLTKIQAYACIISKGDYYNGRD